MFIKAMSATIIQSRSFRAHAKSAVMRMYEKQRRMGEKVNNSLMEKVAATTILNQRLSSAQCQNRAVQNKLQRHKEMTSQSEGYLIGPENQEDIEIRNALNFTVGHKDDLKHISNKHTDNEHKIKQCGLLSPMSHHV